MHHGCVLGAICVFDSCADFTLPGPARCLHNQHVTPPSTVQALAVKPILEAGLAISRASKAGGVPRDQEPKLPEQKPACSAAGTYVVGLNGAPSPTLAGMS